KVPRAFHELLTLGAAADGVVTLLQIGGLAPMDGARTTAVVALRTRQEPLRIAPIADSAVAADVEILQYDPKTRTIANGGLTPIGYHPRMFAAVAPPGASVLVAGGAMQFGAAGFAGDRSIQQGDAQSGV